MVSLLLALLTQGAGDLAMTRKLAAPNQQSSHQKQGVSRTDLWKHDWSRCLAERREVRGQLGWMEFKIHLLPSPNRQTGKLADWQSDWLRRDLGVKQKMKTSSDGTLFFKLLKVKSFLGGWNAACIATWMTAWLVKCNECDETFLISINFKNHVKHPPLFP